MGWDNVVIWTRILLVCGLGYYSYLGYTITVSRRRQGSYHGWDIHAFIPCHLRLNRSSSAQCTGAARPNVQEQLSPMYRSSSARSVSASIELAWPQPAKIWPVMWWSPDQYSRSWVSSSLKAKIGCNVYVTLYYYIWQYATCIWVLRYVYKLDGVGTVNNRHSNNYFNHLIQKKCIYIICDTLHVTCDMWHITCDMWPVSHEGRWTFSQNVRYLAQ